MRKKILVNNGYNINDFSIYKGKNIYPQRYDLSDEGNTVAGKMQVLFEPNLSTDVDIFSELPDCVYENEDAHNFLRSFRKVLLRTKLEGVTLSKLCVSEQSESGLVIDWIFNYFRVYFSFDSEEGNFYGIISSNPEEGSYSNEFRVMDAKQYETLAKVIIDYVIMMIRS